MSVQAILNAFVRSAAAPLECHMCMDECAQPETFACRGCACRLCVACALETASMQNACPECSRDGWAHDFYARHIRGKNQNEARALRSVQPTGAEYVLREHTLHADIVLRHIPRARRVAHGNAAYLIVPREEYEGAVRRLEGT